MNEFTPQVHALGILMLVKSDPCSICNKMMIVRKPEIFPAYFKVNQDAQIKSANLAYYGNVEVDGKKICHECEAAGRADFLCEMCGKRHPTSQIQESFGWPPDFLCKICYGSVPAKQWEEKTEELYESHKYDFS